MEYYILYEEIITMKNMDVLIKQYSELLNEKKEKCKINCDSLIKDNRRDEADLEKIKINIYEIFATFIRVTQRQILQKNFTDEISKYNEFCNEYLESFDKVPNSWREKLEKAKENNSVINIVIEETKLSIASELKDMFTNLM